jgi:hypothetical protein
MAKAPEIGPDACPEAWMSQPGQRQHNGIPCECVEGRYHDGECRCRCGSTPPPRKRDLVDLVQRIAVTEVRPGDVLVFEVQGNPDDREIDEMARSVHGILGDETLSIVVNGRLGGVLRREGSVLVEVTPFDADRRTYLVGGDPS